MESGFSVVTACVVCVCEGWGLRVKLEIGCSTVGALVECRGVVKLGCMRVCVFAV